MMINVEFPLKIHSFEEILYMKIREKCIINSPNAIFSADGNFEVTLATKATLYHEGRVEWKPPAIYHRKTQLKVVLHLHRWKHVRNCLKPTPTAQHRSKTILKRQ